MYKTENIRLLPPLKKLLLVAVLCMIQTLLWAQCPNFTDLYAPNVVCTYGMNDDPFMDTGVIVGRHTVQERNYYNYYGNNYAFDPVLGVWLTTTPLNENNSVMLGAYNYYNSESVSYEFNVDPNNPIIILKLAAFLQQWMVWGFTPPRIVAHVLDAQTGELLDSCAEYEVSVEHLDIPLNIYYNYVYLPWTNITFDLTQYINRNVKLRIINYGSTWTGINYDPNLMNNFYQNYIQNSYNDYYNNYYDSTYFATIFGNYYYYNYYHDYYNYYYSHYWWYNNYYYYYGYYYNPYYYYNYYYYNGYYWYYWYYCPILHYAYYHISCASNHLEVLDCENGTVHVSAPDGYENYLWSDGSTGQTAEFSIPEDEDLRAYCQLTSTTGCVSTLSLFITHDNDMDIPTEMWDTICTDMTYENEFYALPAQMHQGDYSFPNSAYTIDPTGCMKVTDMILYLAVMEHNTTITDAVCEGVDYNRNGFNITAEQIATLVENNPLHPENPVLTFVNEITHHGNCQQTVTLNLQVSEALDMPDNIIGPTDLCTGEEAVYTVSDVGNVSEFQWIVPAATNIISGQGTPELTLSFRDQVAEEVNLMLQGRNGCGSGTISFTIHPHFAVYNFIYDTICSGNSYSDHGFELIRQDSAGNITLTNQGQTDFGCDSIAILNLLIAQTPSLTLSKDPDSAMFCSGDEITINATDLVIIPPEIAIGDIMCDDTTFYTATDVPQALVAGKEPIGVVFYVDSTGQHGWAVALGEGTIRNCIWSRFNSNLTTTASTARNAISCFDGETSTNNLVPYFGTVTPNMNDYGNYPAAAVAYYYDHIGNVIHTTPAGWFLPSAGQLRILFANLPQIENTLHILQNIGILVDTFDGTGSESAYWSSTAYNTNNAWTVTTDGELKSDPKGSGAHRVRSIRNF